ncbi:MAG TPA: hypothetical protein VKA48_12075, partial [Gammaproteobacteria bacterium]|nr:hypothetical protein [Gammaproteobacteria bacterium]
RSVAGVLFLLFAGVPNLCLGGPYIDDMAKCLVDSTSNADKAQLVKWIFSLYAYHPSVKPISKISEEQRHRITKNFGGIVERLLTRDCAEEFSAAANNEGL